MIYYAQRPPLRIRMRKWITAGGVLLGIAIAAFGIISDQRHEMAKRHVLASERLYHVGEYAGAASEARLATQIDPQYARARNDLGYDLFKTGDSREAIVQCRQAVKIDPEDGSAHDNLGYILYETGDLDGAKTQFVHALGIDSEDGEAQAEIGRIMARQGDVPGALVYENDALKIDPKDPVIRRCYGFVLYQNGDKAGAKREWLRCIELGNGDAADQARAYIKEYNL